MKYQTGEIELPCGFSIQCSLNMNWSEGMKQIDIGLNKN